MTNTDKSLNISITKIFNWPSTQPNCCFELVFFSNIDASEIIKKQIAGNYMANSIVLNAYLKITYTLQQSKIIMKMFRKDSDELFGNFQIDLQELREKNVLYYPFGEEFVLQINKYEPVATNDKQIREPKQSMQYEDITDYTRKRLLKASSEKKLIQGPGFKKKFEERIMSLLQEVRSMKNQGPGQKWKQIINSQTNNRHRQSSLTRTKSADLQKVFSNTRAGINMRYPRHRLLLHNLDIVPCEENMA